MQPAEAFEIVHACGPLDKAAVRALMVEAGMMLHRESPEAEDLISLNYSAIMDNGAKYVSQIFAPDGTLERYEEACREVAATHAQTGPPPAAVLQAGRQALRQVLKRQLDPASDNPQLEEALRVILEHAHATMFGKS